MSACWAHALTTEKEEIMGLLVGRMEDDILMISAMKVIRRLTKQKDRVEFDIRDLIAGSELAESLPGFLSVGLVPLPPPHHRPPQPRGPGHPGQLPDHGH